MQRVPLACGLSSCAFEPYWIRTNATGCLLAAVIIGGGAAARPLPFDPRAALAEAATCFGRPASESPASGRSDIDGDGAVGVSDLLRFLDIIADPGTVDPRAMSAFEPAEDPGVAVGNSSRRLYSAIARWDTVPFQAFSGVLNLGVVAFHADGVSGVEFSVPGGGTTLVRTMTRNPSTGVWEYVLALSADSLPDGPVQIGARAIPIYGAPRALPPLALYANAGNSLPQRSVYVGASGSDAAGDGTLARPFQTLYKAMTALSAAGGAAGADNGVINCLPGQYEWRRPDGSATPLTVNAWPTIQPAPGVLRDQVTIVSAPAGQANGGMYTRLVRLRRVTLKASLETITPLEDYFWLDGVRFVGAGMLDPTTYFNSTWWTGMYATDSEATNVVNAFLTMNLVRNCVVDTVYNFSFYGCQAVINSTVRNATGGANAAGQAYHSDLWKDFDATASDNVVLYGINATQNCNQQGIFSRTALQKNMAIVNCALDLRGYPNQSQWRTRTEHMVVLQNSFLGSPFTLGLSDSSSSGFLGSVGVLFRGNVFQWLGLDDPLHVTGAGYPSALWLGSGVAFTNNHFINLWPSWSAGNANTPVWSGRLYGDGATSGLTIPQGRGAYGPTSPPPFLQWD